MESIVELAKAAFDSEDAFDVISETGRFLYVYNSTTLIASVGGIVGFILLASLLWIAIAAALKGEKGYGGGYGGGYGSGGYRKRRFAAEGENEHTFMELLAMLDESFRKMEINSFDCQKRAICEAHLRHAENKVGPVARRINYIFSKMDVNALEALEPESADFFEDYFEAAERGRKNENCAQIYNTCRRSLRDHFMKPSNSVH